MNSTSLQAYIKGFYRDYARDFRPGSLVVAPAVQIDATTGGFLYRENDLRHDLRKDYNSALDSQFRRAASSVGVVSVATKNVKSEYEVIPEIIINSLDNQTGESFVQSSVRGRANQVYANHIVDLVSAAGGLGSDTLNLSTDSVDVFNTIEAWSQDIQKATNIRPNTLYMSPSAYSRFLSQDQLQDGVALASANSPSADRRTGFPVADHAYAWFKTRLGLDLVVEETTVLNGSGVGDFALGTDMILCYSAPGAEQSAFKTAHIGFDGGLIKFIQSPTVLPDPIGVAVAAEAQYKVQLMDANLGLKVALTLS